MQRFAVTVVIPAYNEEATIGDVLSSTTEVMDDLGVPYEIIVVNDGSKDRTGLIASNYKAMVISYEQNRGKGYALKKALQYAQGDIIVTIDSDGEHQPKEIPDLIEPLFDGTDIVAGSRFLGKNSHVTTRIHQFGNFLFNLAIMILTGERVTDSQTGFRAIKRDILEKFNLESDGYEIESEITLKGLANGFVFKEVPISCSRSKVRVSKLNVLTDGTKILKTILKAALLEIE